MSYPQEVYNIFQGFLDPGELFELHYIAKKLEVLLNLSG